MLKPGNRIAAYIAAAVLIVVGIAWYVSTLEGPNCGDSDTGCVAEPATLILVGLVLGTVMPCVVFFGEMLARDRRKRDAAENYHPSAPAA